METWKIKKFESITADKAENRKVALHTACAAGTLILIVIVLICLGWFTGGKEVGTNINQMNASGGDFELAADGSKGNCDNLISAADGEKISIVDESSNTLNLTATGSSNEIKWAVSQDSNFNNNSGSDGIQPGSSGTLSFYVIAKKDSDNLNLKFSLDTVLCDGNENIITNDETLINLVKGHILFFQKCENGVYSEQIKSDNFTFEKPVKANTAYKVDIYWIWPNVIDQLILPKDDSLLSTNGYNRIIDDPDTEIINDMKINITNYFVDLTNCEEMLDNVSKGSADNNFKSDYYNTLNLKWNEADQKIGTNVGYIQLNLTADKM